MDISVDLLTLKHNFYCKQAFVDSADQDQTAQSMHSLIYTVHQFAEVYILPVNKCNPLIYNERINY